MKFLVYAPGPFTKAGGGCMALHLLANNIARLGEESFIFCDSKNPQYEGEIVDEQEAKELAADDSCMVIYPEVVVGNPLNAKHVMRWILYFVRNYDHYGVFGDNDLIYKYAPIYTLRREQTVHGELRAMELNLDLFIDGGGERNGICYLQKKAGHSKPAIHPDNSIQLDDYPTRGGLPYLADVFNKSQMFISYDTATWLSIMAALCGCISLVVPDTHISKNQFHEGYPYFKYGIAYGTDDMAYAKETLPLLRNHLIQLQEDTLKQTADFIATAKNKLCK